MTRLRGHRPAQNPAALPEDVVVQTVGAIPDIERNQLRDDLTEFLASIPGNRRSKIKITGVDHANVARPAIVQTSVQLNRGLLVRAAAAARSFTHASRLVRERMEQHLSYATGTYRPRAWPDPRRGPEPVPIPADQRVIVRRKRYSLVRSQADDAASTMDMRDYDFHLFIDAETSQDSLAYRVGPTGYRLARLTGMAPPSRLGAIDWTIDVHPVPDLTPEQAAQRLNDTDMPFRFFRNTTSGRGAVVYRRLDGHYGLLTAEAPQEDHDQR